MVVIIGKLKIAIGCGGWIKLAWFSVRSNYDVDVLCYITKVICLSAE